MQIRTSLIPVSSRSLSSLWGMALFFVCIGNGMPIASAVNAADLDIQKQPLMISQVRTPAPVMPSAVSQPGAPPPTLGTPGTRVGQKVMPSQPGIPSLQPPPPQYHSTVSAPAQTKAPIVNRTDAPSPGEIAPAVLDQEAPITLFDNQAPGGGGSGPWGDLLSGSIIKIQTLPIDLPSVLKLVETQNLPLLQNKLTARINNLNYYQALSNMLPDIQGSYVQSRFQGGILVFGNSTVQTYQTRIVPQLIASWTVNPGGQDFFTALAAKQRAKGAKFSVLDTLNNQLMTAVNLYYDLLSSTAQVENAKLSIQETESQVKLNQARLTAGVGTKLDLETAKSQLGTRQQILIDAENTQARTQQALLDVLNLDPQVDLAPAQAPVQVKPLVPFEVTTDQLLARALKNNPSLKVSDMELRALRDEAKSSLGAIIPTVTLQTYIGALGSHVNELQLTRFGGFTVQTNLISNLGTAVPLDYATRRLAVKREIAVRAQQIRDLQTLVINAYLDSRSSAKAIMVAQEQLIVAQEAYRLAFGRFKNGLGINVEVLNAQTSLAAARTAVVRAILSFNQAQVRLLNALGDSNTTHIINGIPATVFSIKPAPKT